MAMDFKRRLPIPTEIREEMPLSAELTAKKQAFDAEVANDGTLTDGMNVRVAVRQKIAGQLVVPKSAVVIRDNLEVLFRYKEGRAQWTYVHTSLANSREYVVEANRDRSAELDPGDLIIVSGNLNLADGSEVTLTDNR